MIKLSIHWRLRPNTGAGCSSAKKEDAEGGEVKTEVKTEVKPLADAGSAGGKGKADVCDLDG